MHLRAQEGHKKSQGALELLSGPSGPGTLL